MRERNHTPNPITTRTSGQFRISESTQDMTNTSSSQIQGSVISKPSPFFSYLVEPKDARKKERGKLKGGKKPTKLTKKAYDGLEVPLYFTKEEMKE